jgi:alkylation response protein AidB-like acyl-CoA dehydrogenase
VRRQPEAIGTIARIAKGHAADTARTVTEGSLQVHGGIAFTIEHQLHRYYKHVLGLEGLYGGTRELAGDLGRELLAPGATSWPLW